MGRKKPQLLTLACDTGLSLTKGIGASGGQILPLVMSPDTIEQCSATLDSYRCQVGSDLLHRSFVGVNGVYLALGSLAQKSGATQTLKPLKSETIVYKILAAVSIMAQRFNLGTSFDLDLGCLLPPGEFANCEGIRQSLTLALADFDTPIGVFNVNLKSCNIYVEGMGVVTLQQANNRQTLGTGVTLMAGHRNLTFYTTEFGTISGMETCDLGFNQWAKAVRGKTYDYDLRDLAPVIASYWLKRDRKALDPILRHRSPELRQSELDLLIKTIELACLDYCGSIFKWLDEHLPQRIDELFVAGGAGDVLQTELFEYFHDRMNPHPQYNGQGAIFKSTSFNLPILDVPAEYQSRMADVYCLWKYVMPQPVVKASTTAKAKT
jgi:hypothetical protein